MKLYAVAVTYTVSYNNILGVLSVLAKDEISCKTLAYEHILKIKPEATNITPFPVEVVESQIIAAYRTILTK